MADVAKCKGFFCGGNIKEGSITGDKLDKDSITELIREIIEEGADNWFNEIIKEILQEHSDDWFKELIKQILDDMLDDADGWFKNWVQKWLEEFVKEDWFKDLICSLNCMIPELFDVIPTDITFPATGGESSIEIIVDEDAEWELTD